MLILLLFDHRTFSMFSSRIKSVQVLLEFQLLCLKVVHLVCEKIRQHEIEIIRLETLKIIVLAALILILGTFWIPIIKKLGCLPKCVMSLISQEWQPKKIRGIYPMLLVINQTVFPDNRWQQRYKLQMRFTNSFPWILQRI